ncbi:uncharacterized protein Z518_07120 [Rhinocladiella mackenziei CBS 650.93]|uniref:Rhinocladiella mackenziei CBS 650.93 unplaced genomic scaffold supercont1.5, whole genome shotgun sequence n=1 Tax=Rhinocladiella mackenziei CBS 650.93 TaxID=1442369 RepID=A0A0D2FNF2_9EURO|nr:uncharacterized protein Z518_07120 [Rhinocladiella mackenziei CBS 650.93]KIX03567.1 hypothetical protein Z518_07120 [Rhinocladiella mackenziei CBS 650.93]
MARLQQSPGLMAPARSQLIETAKSVIDGYNKFTNQDILAPRSPTCMHIILPTCAGIPPCNNEPFTVVLDQFLPLFLKIFVLTIDEDEIVVDEAARKVVFHAKSTGESVAGPYRNEYDE